MATGSTSRRHGQPVPGTGPSGRSVRYQSGVIEWGPGQRGTEDVGGLGPQLGQGPVAVDPNPEVDLGDRLHAEEGGNVDQEGQFYGVAVGQAALLQHGARRGRLPGQGLLDGGQKREEQVDDAAWPSARSPVRRHRAPLERSPVEALDQGDRVVGQQRPEQSGHEVGLEVGDIRIDEDDEVALAALSAERMAWPFPPWAVSDAMTRAPACRAMSAVRSSTRRRPRGPRRPAGPRRGLARAETMAWTTCPTVAASLRAGMQTETMPVTFGLGELTASNWRVSNTGPACHRAGLDRHAAIIAHPEPPRGSRRKAGPERSPPLLPSVDGEGRTSTLTAVPSFVQNGRHHPERLRDRAQ